MIRPIDIRLNAAHPELPPPEAVTYTGSPSTVFIRGVPGNCGRWAITAVSVAATFPDGSTTTRAAVQSANGVWVATLPATATSGRTENGFRIMMDAIDENGEAATGYIVAVTDFAVASLDVTPAPQPGETSYQMLYFDEMPGTLRKGDVAKVDGVLKFYNGEAWEAFATPPTLDDAVTRTSANGVKSSGIWSAIWGALASLPTGFSSLYAWCVAQLSGKASTADATLNAASYEYSAWDVSEMPSSFQGQQPYIYPRQDGGDQYYWMVSTGGVAVSDERYSSKAEANAATTITLRGPQVPNGVTVTRTRSVTSYRLGPDAGTNPNRTKLLATAEQGAKADAALPAANVVAPSTDASAEHKAADAKATGDALAGKLDKSGGTMTGSLTLYEPQNGAEIYFPSGGKAKLQFGSGLLNVDDTTGRVTINQKDAAVVDNIPYDRITITTSQLQDHAEQKVTLNAATTTLTLPALTDLTGKVSDFGIDVVNGYEVSGTPTAASFSLAGTIGTDYNLIVPEGEDWSEMSALAAGEMAVYYFTLSAFQINDKPTWEVTKKVVTLVPVPSAP